MLSFSKQNISNVPNSLMHDQKDMEMISYFVLNLMFYFISFDFLLLRVCMFTLKIMMCDHSKNSNILFQHCVSKNVTTKLVLYFTFHLHFNICIKTHSANSYNLITF